MTKDEGRMAEKQSGSGGVDLSAEQVSVSGDVVGRDKIVNSISVLVERALTAAEEAERARMCRYREPMLQS